MMKEANPGLAKRRVRSRHDTHAAAHKQPVHHACVYPNTTSPPSDQGALPAPDGMRLLTRVGNADLKRKKGLPAVEPGFRELSLRPSRAAP